MKFDTTFFASPTGQVVLVGALVVFAGVALYTQRQRKTAALPAVHAAPVAALPRTVQREGARLNFTKVEEPAPSSPRQIQNPAEPKPVPAPPPVLPLSLMTAPAAPADAAESAAPYGRLIPCETVLAIESNRLETPVIGLVTEDVWQAGRRVVPAGAEVHGRASPDRARERLAAEGTWTIVWRAGPENGRELNVRGLALDRERDEATGAWGSHDGSAGLRGEVLRTSDWREVQLFAATFLSSATAALQDTRSAAGLLGETSLPATTARNATLAGTGAVLREYAQQIREAIARDGFYVRIPAGKAFYLYVTEAIDPGRARLGAATPAHAN
ncbi:MAG: TrbI/VirB10 family protein [Opitutaceae bacterium]|nr:TrbI/VirB10 family protein [Opitutaceae bacterium]